MKIYPAILMSFILLLCGRTYATEDSAAEDSVMSDETAAAAAYKKKVSGKVSDSMVNSFVREWGISEDEARCLVTNIKTGDLMRAESDPEVQARIRDCGVDPEVVK